MCSLDSMFLFEVTVEELESLISCKEFYIQSQFADVFVLNLRDPNDLDTLLPKMTKLKKKSKVRKKSPNIPVSVAPVKYKNKVQTGQSVLFHSKIDNLITNMKNFPMELSLYDRDDPENKVGSTHIPWSPLYIDYLYKLRTRPDLSPVQVNNGYNVYDDSTSKKMATIRLNIKLSHLQDKLTTSFRTLSEQNPNTFMYTGFNSKPTSVLCTVQDSPFNLGQETGIIKTIYSGGKRQQKSKKSKTSKKVMERNKCNEVDKIEEQPDQVEQLEKIGKVYRIKSRKLHVTKSDTELCKHEKIEVIKSQSCTAMKRGKCNLLNYIFGDLNVPRNQVYCVGYFTVQNDCNASGSSKGSPRSSSLQTTSDGQAANYKFRICDKECPSMKDSLCAQSHCSLDLTDEASHLIKVTKCKEANCNNKKAREPEPLPDERILLNLSDPGCCQNVRPDKVEQVVGGMKAKMKIDGEECFCSCECTFGYYKKTSYCGVCGGYEYVGADYATKTEPKVPPFPCPFYHKLMDKNKPKNTLSTSEGEGRKKDDQRKLAKARNTESESEHKKDKTDDRFKFNYGYTAPKIGHANCGGPCSGTLGPVPKKMGWLWTAEDIPGLKFRPLWRPGATSKQVVRLLRMAKNPGTAFMGKKKKRDDTTKKRIVRPLLVVAKKDGEFTVTMETMKTYTKPRALNQQPFEDKPVLSYIIGRTEEENRERQKKKDRAKRRLERDQRNYIQNTFRDMCKEICLKTYQQALGILPDEEDPDCTCYPKIPDANKTNLDVSCSCSEDSRSLASDTDSDEWVVEFTPPNATYKPSYAGKRIIKVDNSTQYTYLDYRVKLFDKSGNPVPRFFKGPDGRMECSDLGGFWDRDHNWLEINVDGYIAPDGKWAPMTFIGPHGDQIECENGKFQSGGRWFVVGVDGYVDCNGKWKYYPGGRRGAPAVPQKPAAVKRATGQAGGGEPGQKGDKNKPIAKKSETTWSCFGDVKAEELTQMGILGHGHDKKVLLTVFNNMIAQGANINIPSRAIPPFKGKRRKSGPDVYESKTYFADRETCRHALPSHKGVLAEDEEGNKTYFRLKNAKNRRPKDRVVNLQNQGISLSSFHVPCMRSFINAETMRKERFDRIIALAQGADKNAATQTGG